MSKEVTEKTNDHEDHFENWLKELKDHKLIESYRKHPSFFQVFKELRLPWLLQLKTKIKDMSWALFKPIKYTADFKIVFPKNTLLPIHDLGKELEFKDPRNIIFWYSKCTRRGRPIVYVDVKPPSIASNRSAKLGSSRDFPVKQRSLYDSHNIYINKAVPFGMSSALFGKTFTPDSYLYTEKRTKLRNIKADKYEKRTINQYIKTLLK